MIFLRYFIKVPALWLQPERRGSCKELSVAWQVQAAVIFRKDVGKKLPVLSSLLPYDDIITGTDRTDWLDRRHPVRTHIPRTHLNLCSPRLYFR